MKKSYLKILILSLIISLTSSCDKDSLQNDSQESTVVIIKKESNIVISPANLIVLKEKSLREFDSLSLYKIGKDYNFDINSAYSKLNKYTESEAEKLNFKEVLGSDYDEEYFDKLYSFAAFSVRIYNSNLFKEGSLLQDRESIVQDIILHVLDNSNGFQYETTACGPGYAPCMKKAEKDHKLRIASISASAGFGMALAGWTGVGAGAAAGGWVIGMISSGLQYDNDREYCYEANC